MRKVLIAWELGAGFGHVAHLVPITKAIRARGVRVTAVLSNVARGGPILATVGAETLPCPTDQYQSPGPIFPTRTYSHLLHDVGFDRQQVLASRVGAWRRLISEIQPDFVLCDHSPTALLALRGSPIPRATIGTGFFCPPESAFAEWPVPTPPGYTRDLKADNQHVLNNVNSVLAQLTVPALKSLEQLFAEVDDEFLITVPELDHFTDRQGSKYLGVLQTPLGEPVEWPSQGRQRVFAYLKNFPVLSRLVGSLRNSEYSTLMFIDGPPEHVAGMQETGNFCLLRQPASMTPVAKEADVGITNANHGTICDFLLAGKPLLLIPLTSEQYLLARRVEEAGLGLMAAANDLKAINSCLKRSLADDSFRTAAAEFQQRYTANSTDFVSNQIADRIAELAPRD